MSDLLTSIEQGPARSALAPAAFSVDARVAMQLGRESVASSNTAIVELVKNAYDADARSVKLKFTGLGKEEATLVISDNGHGMTEGEIREHWLCIGTTNKKDSRFSKAGRVQTGEKGLGRLGLDRLCQRTSLQTRRKFSDEEAKQPELFPSLNPPAIELDIQWGRYEVRGERLETIAHEVYALDHLNFDPISGKKADFPHGTRMILQGLKDAWNKERLIELADELSLMLSPFANREDFSISIDTGLNLDGVDGDIAAPADLLEQATWKIEAKIISIGDKETEGHEEVIVTMSSSQHSRSYSQGPSPWKEWMNHGSKENGPTPEVSRCGPTKMLLHVFVKKQNETSAQLDTFLGANRGIRIYRDGFRVKPYGDPKGANDWLSLSMRRAKNPAAISRKGWKLAYHQSVGAVLISKVSNPDLQDQTNREGLVDSVGLSDLHAFAAKAISWFEGKATQDYREQNPPEENKTKPSLDQQGRDIFTQAEAAVADLVKSVESTKNDLIAPPPLNPEAALEAVRAAKTEAKSIERAYEAQMDEMRGEADMISSLASLGIMAAYFGHERVGDAGSIRQKMAELRRLIKNPNDSLFSGEAEKLETVDLLEAGVMRLESFARFALDTVRPWKRAKPPEDFVVVLHKTVTAFRDSLSSSGVKIEPEDILGTWKSYSPLPLRGRTVQWECIVTNLMVNALWALRQGTAPEKTIKLSLTRDNDEIIFVFEDSGLGLEAGTEEDIFRTGFSTKRDHHGKQEGTGLGLTLVSSFVKEAGGSITVASKGELGGARFEIRAPIRKS